MECPVVYTLVAFWEKTGCTIVADYPKDANVCRAVALATINDLKSSEDENVIVNRGKYTVHVLVGELRYVCLTQSEDCSAAISVFKSDTYIFLEKLRSVYRELPILADLSLDLNEYFIMELSEPLRRIVEEHNNRELSKTSILREELSEVRHVLMEAIQNLINRGQKLEELARKTETLRIAVRTNVQLRKRCSKKSSYVMVFTSIAVLTLFLSFSFIVFLYVRALINS